MDNYSKVLTFFMENGIQLTTEQLEALKEEFLLEKKEKNPREVFMKGSIKEIEKAFKDVRCPLRGFGFTSKVINKKEFISGEMDMIEYATCYSNANSYNTYQEMRNFESKLNLAARRFIPKVNELGETNNITVTKYTQDNGTIFIRIKDNNKVVNEGWGFREVERNIDQEKINKDKDNDQNKIDITKRIKVSDNEKSTTELKDAVKDEFEKARKEHLNSTNESTDESFLNEAYDNVPIKDYWGKDSGLTPKEEKKIRSYSKKAVAAMKKYASELYDDWYDLDERGKSWYASKKEVLAMVDKLFDTITYDRGASKGLEVIYWTNNHYSKNPELSRKFFGNHSITYGFYLDPDTLEIKEELEPQLEG